MKDIILVSFGALFGANTRFIIYEKLKILNLSNYYSILIINTFASFSLGLFISLLPTFKSHGFSYQLILFFSIGFLGSLSTFSTFVYDLFEAFLQNKFLRASKLFFISSTLGIFAIAFGFFLGNQ